MFAHVQLDDTLRVLIRILRHFFGDNIRGFRNNEWGCVSTEPASYTGKSRLDRHQWSSRSWWRLSCGHAAATAAMRDQKDGTLRDLFGQNFVVNALIYFPLNKIVSVQNSNHWKQEGYLCSYYKYRAAGINLTTQNVNGRSGINVWL
jgi:hypothetical protein